MHQTHFRRAAEKMLTVALLDASLAYTRRLAYSFSVTNSQSVRRISPQRLSASNVVDSPADRTKRRRRPQRPLVPAGAVPVQQLEIQNFRLCYDGIRVANFRETKFGTLRSSYGVKVGGEWRGGIPLPS